MDNYFLNYTPPSSSSYHGSSNSEWKDPFSNGNASEYSTFFDYEHNEGSQTTNFCDEKSFKELAWMNVEYHNSNTSMPYNGRWSNNDEVFSEINWDDMGITTPTTSTKRSETSAEDSETYTFDRTVGSKPKRYLNNENTFNIKKQVEFRESNINFKEYCKEYFDWIKENPEELFRILLNPNPLSIIRDSLLKNRIALHASTIEYKQWTDFVDYNKELVFMKKAFLKMEQFVKDNDSNLTHYLRHRNKILSRSGNNKENLDNDDENNHIFRGNFCEGLCNDY